jgi:S-DNA-T family DNA segregation ATPase FtsK/SpoIIIE
MASRSSSSTRTRKAPARKSTARRRPPTRRRRRQLRRLHIQLDQRAFDVIGLGLVALGVFMGCVLYAQWNGGTVGNGLSRALAWLFGQVRDGVPIALAVYGSTLVLRPLIGTTRPLRASPLFLFASSTLALAAGTLDFTGPVVSTSFWQAPYFEHRGGIVGQGEYWAVDHLVGTLGANFLAVFLFLAGVLLLSGGSIALMLRSAGAGIADATARIPTVSVADLRAERHRERPERVRPPEPPLDELFVRAARLDAASLQGEPAEEYEPGHEAEPFGTLFVEAEPLNEADNEQLPLPAVDEEQLTPMGRFRAAVTDDPSFEWRLPRASLLTRSTSEQTRPDTAGQAKVAARLVEALGHFGVRATVVGTVAGPHITRYELRLAPGIKVA